MFLLSDQSLQSNSLISFLHYSFLSMITSLPDRISNMTYGITNTCQNKKILAAYLAVVFILQAMMVFRFEMNWDEFLLLDWVYDWREGNIKLPLQTIYLRAFSWLPYVSDSEVSQIIAARCIMFCCFLLTSGFLFCITRRYFSIEAAILTIICYATFSFVFRHASSFRMDTLVTTMLMLVLWCITHPRFSRRHILVASASLGLAGMITIKAIFYVPTIAVLLLARWIEQKWNIKPVIEGACLGLISLFVFGLLYYLHSSSLKTGVSGAEYVTSVVGGSLIDHGLFPQLTIIKPGILRNLPYVLLFVTGITMLFIDLLSRQSNWLFSVRVLAFALPVLTLAFYLHAYPYYYTFMLAPASVLIAGAYDKFIIRYRIVRTPILLLLISISFYPALISSFKQTNDYQKQVVEVIHEIFPQPTAFIDRTGMISSFDQKWFFMASWQMLEYYKKNTPLMNDILEQEKPAFLLANVGSLDIDKLSEEPIDKRLLPDDENALKQNYIHHWGPVYVPGKKIVLDKANTEFDIHIAGTYTVETGEPVEINGTSYAPGSQIKLLKGRHIATSTSVSSVTLRWGTNLYKPGVIPLGDELFRGF